jgi:transcriptional regulator with XRE-family HTH domain
MNINAKLGNRLREIRKREGLTQEELATKAGFHRTYAGNIERGLENPTIEAVAKLADVLDVPVRTLFEFDDADDA